MGRKLLITASVLNIIIGVLHVAALFFFMDWALTHTGGDQFVKILPAGIPGSPYTETAVVTAAFILMGIYGLSAAGMIRKLPLLKLGIILIIILYLVRGLGGLTYQIVSAEGVANGVLTSAIALFIGICYLRGAMWRWHKRRKSLDRKTINS